MSKKETKEVYAIIETASGVWGRAESEAELLEVIASFVKDGYTLSSLFIVKGKQVKAALTIE